MTQNNENAMCLVRRDDLKFLLQLFNVEADNSLPTGTPLNPLFRIKQALANPLPNNQGWRTDMENAPKTGEELLVCNNFNKKHYIIYWGGNDDEWICGHSGQEDINDYAYWIKISQLLQGDL